VRDEQGRLYPILRALVTTPPVHVRPKGPIFRVVQTCRLDGLLSRMGELGKSA